MDGWMDGWVGGYARKTFNKVSPGLIQFLEAQGTGSVVRGSDFANKTLIVGRP
jgi:hypothetical protein